MPDETTLRAGAALRPSRHARLAGMLLLALLAAALIGCGGGGGGDGGDADPLAPEIGAQVDGFVAAVNAEDIGGTAAGAMYYIDSNISYFRADTSGFLRYSAFRDTLQQFVASCSEVNLSIDGREFTSNGETWALCAGTLNCSWKDSAGNPQTLSEPVQIEWQRFERWGITKLSRHDTSGLQFPPAP